MTNELTDSAVQETRTARTALTSGIASVILAILYLTPFLGVTTLYGSILFGVVAVVTGILALRRRQPKGWAITGLILGAISALFGVSVFLFALAFVGAI